MVAEADSLRLVRTFDIAPARLFDAWVNPAIARLWLFAAAGAKDHHLRLDPRVGGHWTITERRDGTSYIAEGEYREVDWPRRLAFTFAMPQLSPNQDLVTVAIEPDGGGAIVTLTQSGPDIANELATLPAGEKGGTERGWIAMLDRLQQTLR
jgi:uncharacterized protein YndB with AHSA1/START domain